MFLPDSLSTVVELGFTSSIRFLQPGLLLHGRPAPHSKGSRDDTTAAKPPGSGLLGAALSWGAQLLQQHKPQQSPSSPPGPAGPQEQQHQLGSNSGQQPQSDRPLQPTSAVSVQSKSLDEGGQRALSTGMLDKSAQGGVVQEGSQAARQPPRRLGRKASVKRQQQQVQAADQQPLLWPWQPQPKKAQPSIPRSSWRHRKEIEEAGQLEVRDVKGSVQGSCKGSAA